MTLSRNYEIRRQEVWLAAYAAVASSANCDFSDTAFSWADKCLREFDRRFRESKG